MAASLVLLAEHGRGSARDQPPQPDIQARDRALEAIADSGHADYRADDREEHPLRIERTLPPAAAPLFLADLLHALAAQLQPQRYLGTLEKELKEYFGV